MTNRGSKNTSGRKHITKKPHVKHRGALVLINSQGSGTYSATVKKSYEQFDLGLDRWKRQLFIMFQLKPGCSGDTNEVMTRLLRRVKYQFQKLGLVEFGFHWCRELERGKGAHYHLAIWLDGDKYRTSHTPAHIVKDAWEQMGGQYDSLRKRYLFVDDDKSRLDALFWLSYLSKGRGKGNRPVQTKDHGMSRLKALSSG